MTQFLTPPFEKAGTESNWSMNFSWLCRIFSFLQYSIRRVLESPIFCCYKWQNDMYICMYLLIALWNYGVTTFSHKSDRILSSVSWTHASFTWIYVSLKKKGNQERVINEDCQLYYDSFSPIILSVLRMKTLQGKIVFRKLKNFVNLSYSF